MNELDYRVQSWQRYQSTVEAELNRRAFLNKPLPSSINPPELYTPVKVRVVNGSFVDHRSQVRHPGEVISIPRALQRTVCHKTIVLDE